MTFSSIAKADIYFSNLSKTSITKFRLITINWWDANFNSKLLPSSNTFNAHGPGSHCFETDGTKAITLDSIDVFDKKTRLSDAIQQGYIHLPFIDVINPGNVDFTSTREFPIHVVYEGKTNLLITVINNSDAKKYNVRNCMGSLCAIITPISAL